MPQFLLFIFLLANPFKIQQANTEKGIVYFSFDNGRTWVNTSEGIPENVFLSDMATGTDFLGLTTKKDGIFIFDFQTNQWRQTETTPAEGDEINVIYFYLNKIFVGTKNKGIFTSPDKGKTWTAYNNGLNNLTIRKFLAIDNKLYVGTNAGLYIFDEATKKWKAEYTQGMLQVNGIKEFKEEIYIGTNQGAFKKKKSEKEWTQILSDYSLHNISADSKNVYALTYNELLISNNNGFNWSSDQKGMPAGKYTFQIIEKYNTVLAGQWDGVYIKTKAEGWRLSNTGMPQNLPILELIISGDIIVAGSSQWSK